MVLSQVNMLIQKNNKESSFAYIVDAVYYLINTVWCDVDYKLMKKYSMEKYSYMSWPDLVIYHEYTQQEHFLKVNF